MNSRWYIVCDIIIDRFKWYTYESINVSNYFATCSQLIIEIRNESTFAQDISAARANNYANVSCENFYKNFLERKHSTDITNWTVPRPSDTDAGLFRAISSSDSTPKRRVSKEKLPGMRKLCRKLPAAMHSAGDASTYIRRLAGINHPVPKATGRNFPMNVASTDFSSPLRGALSHSLPITRFPSPIRLNTFGRFRLTKFKFLTEQECKYNYGCEK